MSNFEKILSGGDLRSIGKSNFVVTKIQNQKNFDDLFQQLFNTDRKIVMRAADALEKITIKNPDYLKPHKQEILSLCRAAKDIELKWHLALIVPRIKLTKTELEKIWQTLSVWAKDKSESKIVRVNSVQGLFNLLPQNQNFIKDYQNTIAILAKENIPSLNARIKKLNVVD
jgi:hypothetical protein